MRLIHLHRLILVSPEMVAKKIKATNDNNLLGVDEIPAEVFNLSLKEQVVPFEWKEANIMPLFEKGSRNK